MHICFKCVPHARGDEPRSDGTNLESGDRVPHARGDEPHEMLDENAVRLGVPHARGDEPMNAELLNADGTVFPTHVGMNRIRISSGNRNGDRVPHARGDEPLNTSLGISIIPVFPTHVGMNRQIPPGSTSRTACSPRTWG